MLPVILRTVRDEDTLREWAIDIVPLLVKSRPAMTEAQKEARWRVFAAKTEAWERVFRREVVKLFEKQRLEVLNNLGSKAGRARILANIYAEIAGKAGIADWIFDEKKWRVRFSEMGQLLLPQIVEEAGEAEMGTLLVEVAFDVTNPRVVEFLDKKVHKFSFEVNETTIKQLKREFRVGLAEGEGIPQLRKRVEKVFNFAERYRSERIARTEVIGASNFGGFESYQQSGVVPEKDWLATKDTRTRDTHVAMDGERAALNDPFSNGLMYPGDPSGPPEEIINCRCTLLPIVKE